MQIFYACDVYLNKPMASTTHVKEIIVNLIGLGHEVRLYAPRYGAYSGDAFAPTVYVPTTNIRIFRVLLFYTLIGPILAVACLRRRPDIIYIREMFFSTPVQLVAALFHIPNVVEVNGFNDVEMERGGASGGLEIRIARWLQGLNVRFADRLIAVSPKIEEGLVNRYQVKADRIAMFRNGANTTLFFPMDRQEACRAAHLTVDARYICFVGSFYPFHGIDDLVRAFTLLSPKCPETRLLLVGDGSERPRITRQVENIDPSVRDRVHFTGAVPHEEVPLYINSAEVCVAPYNNQLRDVNDLSPLKIFEGLACGRPVISTPILGNLLQQAKAGITVPAEDSASLAEAILMLLNDPARRAVMGRHGRRFVLEHCTWRHTAVRTAELCTRLLPLREGG